MQALATDPGQGPPGPTVPGGPGIPRPPADPAAPSDESRAEARRLFQEGLGRSDRADYEGAAAAFRRVIELDPSIHQAYHNLGRALEQAGRPEQAMAVYGLGLERHPGYHRLALQIGRVVMGQGRTAEALPWLERACRLAPEDRHVLNDLGCALSNLGRVAEAAETFDRALRVAPGEAVLHYNLARALRSLGREREAIAHLGRAVEIRPAYPRAWSNLGTIVRRYDEGRAIDCYERALALDPEVMSAIDGLLSLSRRACDFDRTETLHERLVELAPLEAETGDNWRTLSGHVYDAIFRPLPDAAHRRLVKRLGVLLTREVAAHGPLPPLPAPTGADRARRPRVGFLSPNFGSHPVGHVTLSLFGRLDRTRLEVHGLSLRRGGSDGTAYARAHRADFDAFHELGDLPPRAVAGRVRALGIDLLVDLDGLMETVSPLVLAFRPAPVQVFWLGHAGGLGLPFVDYLIADAVVVPPGEEGEYVERVVRLPETYHCAAPHPIAPAAPSRAECGLPEDGFVFCAFNNPEKVDRRAFDAWMRILARVPGSVLWLSSFRQDRARLLANLGREAAARGVDPARLILAERVPAKTVHLARHAHAGLLLDTLTLNASTTALDALWAGVPVLAVRGDRFANRISTSMLRAVGLEDLVCPDLAAYEDRAVELATHPERLAALRARLRTSRETRPLFDLDRFARHLEAALEGMWARHLRAEPPAGFDVPAAPFGGNDPPAG